METAQQMFAKNLQEYKDKKIAYNLNRIAGAREELNKLERKIADENESILKEVCVPNDNGYVFSTLCGTSLRCN